jgi:predicted Zn-dependent peptidase
MLGNLVTELESTDDLAYWFGVQQLLLNEIKSIDEVKDKIKKITKDQIVNAWELLLRENNLKIAAIGPRKDLNLDKLIENVT